ncbi:MAG: MFS transporter [Acidobacteria bacterium]|nr:MAG: MFS transporter [Acidobacteriota bacterium]
MAELTDDDTATAVRWRIVALLAGFSLVSYALRTNISIAAALMRSDLHLSQVQLGQIFSAFLIGYAVFQVPAGALGDRFGARLVLTVAAAVWGLTTVMTGALPGIVTGAAGTLTVLMIVRFLLGAAEAATYPVATSAVGVWMPASERVFANSLVIAGMALGSAVMPPVISRVMVASGWRAAFYATSILGFLIAGIWWWYARDDPARHPAVKEHERQLIAAGRPPAAAGSRSVLHWPLLRNRNIALISASYFLDSYVLATFVFWFYLYLVDERHFSMLNSGFFSSLPWIAALILVPASGRWCDRLSARRGRRVGRRVVAMTALAVSSALLLFGARTEDPILAIAALSLSVGFLMATEGPFWSSAIDIAGAHAGTAGGIMNTAGNLGGVAQASVVPFLVERFGWIPALATGSALALVSALLWLFIRVDESVPDIAPAEIRRQ